MSVFDLWGRDENDLTAALGFTLARSPSLLRLVAGRLLPNADADRASVRLETSDELGRTDLEIDTGTHLAVIEAKRAWLIPGETQLGAYAPRIKQRVGGVLVSLSDARSEWAAQILPASVQGVPVVHLPWASVRSDLSTARARAHGRERLWLDEFHEYLRRAIKMLDPADSWTYCVVLSNSRPGGGGARTFREFVTVESCYFHPYGWGAGWPKTPPNFLAFRWDGMVQRVHRVISSEIIPNLQAFRSDIPLTENEIRPHVLYKLGPQILGTPIPNGRQYRASRLWVLLDQLLVNKSLADAHDGTKRITAS